MNQRTLSNISRNTTSSRRGFTLLEVTITVGIIALLAGIILANVLFARDKARDTKRIADLSQIGRLVTFGCYVPSGGVTQVDLAILAAELSASNPQYSKYLNQIPRDPATGTVSQTNYTYIISADGQKCALVANLEIDDTVITLTSLSDPTPGGGTGVVQGSTTGANGTTIYYQYSN